MEVQSNIYGRKVKLYIGTGPTEGGSSTDLWNAFQNATFVRYVDCGFPIWHSILNPPIGDLFMVQTGNPDSIFNSELANEIDSGAPNWQQAPMLYVINEYTGRVPLTQFLNLFPHKIDISSLSGNVIFLTDDDLSVVEAVRFRGSRRTWGFRKDDGTNINNLHFANMIICGLGTSYNTDKMIAISLHFIHPTFHTGPSYNSLGSATTGMVNTVRLSEGTNSTFEYHTGFNENYASDDDPYSGGDDDEGSETGGGDGDHDDDSDEVDNDPIPTISATDTGFISLWNPSQLEIKSLANYMWSNLFDITTFKKLFADPMDCILGLSIMPGPVPSGAYGVVTVGNIATNISMHKCANQFYEIDCGEVNLKEYWGAYIDYAPYTKVELFLPYCGTHQINADEVMKKTIKIVYRVDILSGACVASVKCGSELLYMFQGQCSVSIPITSLDWTSVINGMMNIAANFGSLIGTGGKTADSQVNDIVATAVNSLKPDIQKTGAIESAGGLLAKQKPYFIITRPRQARPVYQNKFTGYPGFITRSIGELTGFTQMEVIRLSGVSATDEEMKEIEDLLKEGVIC